MAAAPPIGTKVIVNLTGSDPFWRSTFIAAAVGLIGTLIVPAPALVTVALLT